MARPVSVSTRRAFLTQLAGGGLLIAVNSPLGGAAAAVGQRGTGASIVNGWLRIAPTGEVTVLSNTSEIGQGTGTALAQILADELDLDWHLVRIGMAPVEARYFNPQWGEYATYGSGGIAGQFGALRTAGAQARAMLIAAAAGEWRVPVAECATTAGEVVHAPTGRRSGYGPLAAAAARQPPPADVKPRAPSQWRFIGKEVARLDIPAKVDGSATYGIDIRLPGMLVAAIRQSPRFGGRLARVDPAPALAVKGVRHVVPIGDAVAVVAGDYWTAATALARLTPVWDDAAASSATSADYARSLRDAALAGGVPYVAKGGDRERAIAEFEAAIAPAAAHVEAVYSVPFLSHAPMEPMNATALVSQGRAELWVPTQDQSAAITAVAAELKLPPEAVTLHTTLSGGGFGRRIEYDFVLQAVRIAKVVGVPVKLVWSREEDMQHDFYRPAAAIRLRAGVGADGMPLGLRFDTACESLLTYSRGGGDRAEAVPFDPSALGALPSYYSIAATLFTVRTVDVGVPVGYWRSVAASQNVFAYESFFDEVAHASAVEPAAWRRRLIAPGSRLRRVLDAALERADWEQPAAAGRFRGIGLVRANGTCVAHVVELAVDGTSRIRLHRITSVVDCGIAVNPNSVRAQIEGGLAFALSAAMYGEITVETGAVVQSNFNDYPLIRLSQMPPLDIVILDSREAPGGVGEEAVSPLAPALANAIFAATGRRIRELPLSRAGLSLS